MSAAEWVSISLCAVGSFFFLAGSVGIMRLPDVFLRIHASAKADNLGLAFVLAGVAVEAGSLSLGLKLLLIWVLLIVSSATSCNLIAQKAIEENNLRRRPK